MIRVMSIAALLATGALLPASSASAATNLNARIDLLTNILRTDAQFSARDFSFSLRNGQSQTLVFRGLEGVRRFSDYAMLNSWMLEKADAADMFEGGTYRFTHNVVDSYFVPAAPAAPASAPHPAPSMFDGAPYTFTHSVLGSYFSPTPEPKSMARSSSAEPLMQAMMAPPPAIPEPATWAMMIGGFAMAGGLLRARKGRLRTA